MPYLRKARAGSDPFGHVWDHDGSVVFVEPHEAQQLLALTDGGFSEVLPGQVVNVTSTLESHTGLGETPDGSIPPTVDPLLALANTGHADLKPGEDDGAGAVHPVPEGEAVRVTDDDSPRPTPDLDDHADRDTRVLGDVTDLQGRDADVVKASTGEDAKAAVDVPVATPADEGARADQAERSNDDKDDEKATSGRTAAKRRSTSASSKG